MAATSSVVGRERELATVEAVLDKGGPRLLMIAGEPGIGKSTLWAAAVEAARRLDRALLTARPDANERELPYAGLSDLFDERTLDAVLPRLSGPRRRALETALQRAEPVPNERATDPARDAPRATNESLDRVALGLAVLDAFRWLASAHRLVVAVDDLDCWDEPTAAAVAFAV
ncbi:MAG TPA: ATP-binding protein, partial [Candidatus Limnocylindrales bacterium]